MSHAGQLLAESPEIDEESRRLTDIIRVNARRVSQIVESVLALSRRKQARPERLQLLPWLEDFAREFAQTLELYEGAIAVTDASEDAEAEMDPTHLHQIVWNLCDNAVKYATASAGTIAVELSCGHLAPSGRPYLEVAAAGSIHIDRNATGCRNAVWYSSVAAVTDGRLGNWDKSELVIESTGTEG